jgi:hypothetical protein
MSARLTVEELNEREGTCFRSGGHYEGGEFGAERLLDERGRAFVLKGQPPGRGPRTVDVLRAHGYPASRYAIVAEQYSVQEELPGEPLADWNVPAERGRSPGRSRSGQRPTMPIC